VIGKPHILSDKKRAIYCTGLSPLINLLCSEKITGETITYIDIDNIYDPTRFGKDHERELYLAKIFCDFFNVKFNSVKQIKCSIPPDLERTITNYWIGKSDLILRNGDLVSSFTIAFLNPRNVKIEIFAEGASALEWININPLSNSIVKSIWLNYVKPVLRKIKNTILQKNLIIKKRIIFGDRMGSIKNFPKYKNIEVVDFDIINKNMKKLSTYLADTFPEIDYRKYSGSFLHLVIDEMSNESYELYVAGVRHIIGNKKLIIKKHPRDRRDYSEIFKNFNLLYVPENFRSLPAELILIQSDIKLWSYISTVLLSVNLSKVLIVEPPDKKLVDLFEDVYRELFKVLPVKSSILTLAELKNIQDFNPD
jgi:hypothetical protein